MASEERLKCLICASMDKGSRLWTVPQKLCLQRRCPLFHCMEESSVGTGVRKEKEACGAVAAAAPSAGNLALLVNTLYPRRREGFPAVQGGCEKGLWAPAGPEQRILARQLEKKAKGQKLENSMPAEGGQVLSERGLA